MDRVPDVFLVHAHAECLRGAHDGELVVEEFLLDARTLVLSASMVGICKYAASSQVGQDSFARCWVLVKVVLEVREDDSADRILSPRLEYSVDSFGLLEVSVNLIEDQLDA